MRPWKLSGAASNAKLCTKARLGQKSAHAGPSSSTSKRSITGRGSTARWATNHLWTLNSNKTNNAQNDLLGVHKKGGRELRKPPSILLFGRISIFVQHLVLEKAQWRNPTEAHVSGRD